MLQFFNKRQDRKDLILAGDVKLTTSKYLLVKNFYMMPDESWRVPIINNNIVKNTKWSVLSKDISTEYKATSLIDALRYIFIKQYFKFKKDKQTNIFKKHVG